MIGSHQQNKTKCQLYFCFILLFISDVQSAAGPDVRPVALQREKLPSMFPFLTQPPALMHLLSLGWGKEIGQVIVAIKQ